MSNPIPNSPHTRIWLTVFGGAPSAGSTKAPAKSPSAVRASTFQGRLSSIGRLHLFAARHAEQALRPQQQHQGHHREQHDPGISRVDHRSQAEDLAGNQPTEDRSRERADAADNDND